MLVSTKCIAIIQIIPGQIIGSLESRMFGANSHENVSERFFPRRGFYPGKIAGVILNHLRNRYSVFGGLDFGLAVSFVVPIVAWRCLRHTSNLLRAGPGQALMQSSLLS